MDELAEKLRDNGGSYSLQKELLSVLRSSKIRRADLVQEYGSSLLIRSRSRLGDDGKG